MKNVSTVKEIHLLLLAGRLSAHTFWLATLLRRGMKSGGDEKWGGGGVAGSQAQTGLSFPDQP